MRNRKTLPTTIVYIHTSLIIRRRPCSMSSSRGSPSQRCYDTLPPIEPRMYAHVMYVCMYISMYINSVLVVCKLFVCTFSLRQPWWDPNTIADSELRVTYCGSQSVQQVGLRLHSHGEQNQGSSGMGRCSSDNRWSYSEIMCIKYTHTYIPL